MNPSITIRGIHPVEAEEPCHLIEVAFSSPVADDRDVNWGDFTQENPAQPRDNWQVAYDEQPVGPAGRTWAFFFHYIDFGKPL